VVGGEKVTYKIDTSPYPPLRGMPRGMKYGITGKSRVLETLQRPWQDTRDVAAHGGSRPPEAGAQVRILPGAHNVQWCRTAR